MSILQHLPFSLCEPGPEHAGGIGNFYLQVVAPAPSQLALPTVFSGFAQPDTEIVSSKARLTGSPRPPEHYEARVVIAVRRTMIIVTAPSICLWLSCASPFPSSVTAVFVYAAAIGENHPKIPASIHISTTLWPGKA